MKALCLAT